jgi:hypothetical protein
MRHIAMLVSYLLHPVVLPAYAIIFLVLSNQYIFPPADAWRLIAITVFNSVFIPLFMVMLMRLLGFIENIELPDIRERILVFIPVSCMFIWTFLALRTNALGAGQHIVTDVMLGATILLFAALIITVSYTKISLHTMGMGALLAIAMASASIAMFDVTNVIMGVIFLAGLSGTARLLLNAHNYRQVYWGYMIGFLCQSLVLIF